MPPSRTLVFVNNKTQADFLDDYLFNMGLPSTSIHSDRTQREREDALYVFHDTLMLDSADIPQSRIQDREVSDTGRNRSLSPRPGHKKCDARHKF